MTKSFVVIFILLTVIPLTALNPANTLIPSLGNRTLVSSRTCVGCPPRVSPISPGPDLGITNWTHNHIEEPSFEDWINLYNPREWDVQKNNDRYHWFATDIVSEGTYSGGILTRSNPSSHGWAYWYQSGFDADAHNLTLSFDWYADLMPDPNYDYFMIYLPFNNNHGIWYYLAGATLVPVTNTSLSAFYKLNGPLQSWQTFSRNITSDYLIAFPGPLPSTFFVLSIYFYIQTGTVTNQWLRTYFDDVQMVNGTTTYIGGTTRNGNLEDPSFGTWNMIGNYDASYATRSTTAHSGLYSCNVTGVSNGNTSGAQVYQNPNIRITNQNPGIFSMWWQLNQDHVTDWDYTMIFFEFSNETDLFTLYYIIGHGGLFVFMNTSIQHYYLIDGFNTTGSWQYFQCNLWQAMTSAFSSNDAIVRRFSLIVVAGNLRSRVEVLIDNVRFRARTVSDADYEDQGDPGTPIMGWNNQYSTDFIVTDQGYGGGKAANCSFSGFGQVNLEHDLHLRSFNSTRETYLDVMWRIEDFTDTGIQFSIKFSAAQRIYYVIATNNWGSLGNTTLEVYFNVTGSGTVGSWIQLHRDLVHDYEAAFGILPDTIMDALTFSALSTTGNFEVLFDDLYIYDDPAPILSNVILTPGTPVHGQAVQVDLDIIEKDLDTPFLIYRVDSGVFNFLIMAHYTGNTYRATIPGAPYNSVIEYFFQVNDTWGMLSTLQDGLVYFRYTVDDQTNPLPTITAPSDGAVVSGTVDIEVTATDGESGMDRVEFAVDGAPLGTDSSTPYNYTWDSTTVLDGSHTITITAYDITGNQAVDSVTITSNNMVTPPPPFPINPLLIAAIVVIIIIVIIVMLLLLRQRSGGLK